jgi:hypothetical protein
VKIEEINMELFECLVQLEKYIQEKKIDVFETTVAELLNMISKEDGIPF